MADDSSFGTLVVTPRLANASNLMGATNKLTTEMKNPPPEKTKTLTIRKAPRQREEDMSAESKLPASAPASPGGVPQPPPLQLAPPPVVQPTSITHQWGSLAMIFAGLGSLLTRGHATTALNAAADVMKGFHQGDQEAANAAFQTWKVSNDNLAKMANYEAQMYKATMSDFFKGEQLTLSEKRNEIAAVSAVARANHDVVIEHLLEQKNLQGVADEVDKRQKNALELVTLGQKAQVAVDQRNAMIEWRKNHLHASELDAAIEQKRITGQGMTSDEVDALAKGVASGNLPISPTMLRSPTFAPVVEKVRQLDPNFNASTFAVQQAMRKALTQGPLGTTITAIRTSENHLATLQELAAALHNGQTQVVNALVNKTAREFGDPRITNFDAAKDIVGNEVAKAIAASGALSAGERNELRDMFKDASSPEQLQGAVNTVKQLMAGRLNSISTQIKTSGVDPSHYGITPDLVQFYNSPAQGAAIQSLSANEVQASISNAKRNIQAGKDPGYIIRKMRDAGISDQQMQAAGINTGGY